MRDLKQPPHLKVLLMLRILTTLVRTHIPLLEPMVQKLRPILLNTKPVDQVFTEIYVKQKWGNEESVSGPGSKLARTKTLRLVLPPLLEQIKCDTLLDIPCGDFNWMKTLDLEVTYKGADIVEALVQSNQILYRNDKISFQHLDLLHDSLPKADVVLCRDCFVHFSFHHIFKALHNIRASGAKYLLTSTFTQRARNHDILTGEWRAINLQKPPFNFPAPLALIDETAAAPNYYDKHLGLWRVDDITVPLLRRLAVSMTKR
jgi:hypothetical protein